MSIRLRAALFSVVLALSSLATSAGIVAAANYGTCDASNSNILYYEYRNNSSINGLEGSTWVRSLHPCTNGSSVGQSLVPIVNLQGPGYFVQFGYGFLTGQTSADFMVTTSDTSSGTMAYVRDLYGSDPIPYLINDAYRFEVGFAPGCVVCYGTWRFTIYNISTGASATFTQPAHVINIGTTGLTQWWGAEVYNDESQMGGPDSIATAKIYNMAWSSQWTANGPVPWQFATTSQTTTICRNPPCTFPSYYVRSHGTDGNGREYITVYTTDVP